MSSLQLVNRLIASETEIAGEKLKKGNLEPWEWEQLNARIGKLTNAPIFINDTPGLSVFETTRSMQKVKGRKGHSNGNYRLSPINVCEQRWER